MWSFSALKGFWFCCFLGSENFLALLVKFYLLDHVDYRSSCAVWFGLLFGFATFSLIASGEGHMCKPPHPTLVKMVHLVYRWS